MITVIELTSEDLRQGVT